MAKGELASVSETLLRRRGSRYQATRHLVGHLTVCSKEAPSIETALEWDTNFRQAATDTTGLDDGCEQIEGCGRYKAGAGGWCLRARRHEVEATEVETGDSPMTTAVLGSIGRAGVRTEVGCESGENSAPRGVQKLYQALYRKGRADVQRQAWGRMVVEHRAAPGKRRARNGRALLGLEVWLELATTMILVCDGFSA